MGAAVGGHHDPLTMAALFVGLFSLSFMFSGTETAFFSLQQIDRRRIAEGETRTHRLIHAILERRTALITTILMVNETVNVAISVTAAGLFASIAPGQPWLTVVLVTPSLLLFSEITPKVIAWRFNRAWVDVAIWPFSVVWVVLSPPRFLIGGLVNLLARAFGVHGTHAQLGMAEQEFMAIVERSAVGGAVDEGERELIEAVFDLDDMAVSRLMTPAPDIFSLPANVSWSALLAACQEARFSRVPIYDASPDDIVGVLLVKDLLKFRRKPFTKPEELRAILIEPSFVPATKPAHDMMREMLKRRIHIAFVVDEHGTLMGLVSLDDLIIELVGEIGDELDDGSEEEDIVKVGDVLHVRASVDLEDLQEERGITLPDGEYHTVGGFVFHVLGRIPEVGDVVDEGGHRFTVAGTEGRRATLLHIRPITVDDANEGDA